MIVVDLMNLMSHNSFGYFEYNSTNHQTSNIELQMK